MIRVSGVNEGVLKLQLLASLVPAVADKTINISLINIEREAKKDCPVDLGITRASVHHDLKNLVGQVIVDGAGAWLEFGTRPHTPPFQPIYEWVGRVLGIGGDDTEQEEVTWAIIKNIEQYGTPARPFLFPAAELERPAYIKRLGDNLRQALISGKQG